MNFDLPLIWTADFILDVDPLGQDAYRLGELNCSCVGEYLNAVHSSGEGQWC